MIPLSIIYPDIWLYTIIGAPPPTTAIRRRPAAASSVPTHRGSVPRSRRIPWTNKWGGRRKGTPGPVFS
jgi:hypothetical protein